MENENDLLDAIKTEEPDFKSAAPGETIGIPRVLDIGEVLNEPCTPVDYIFYPWLNRQGIAIVFAERGVGKTYFSLNTALAIARGGEFLRWYSEKPARVLYVDGEMPFFAIKERIVMINKMYAYNEPAKNFSIITPDKYNNKMPDLTTEDGQNSITQIIIEREIEVLVIDNIACLMPRLSGNDNDSWARLVQPWLLELRRRGITTLIVHHAGKRKEDEPVSGRGSSGKEDVVDTVISLTRPVGYEASQGARFNIEFKKNRHFFGTDAESFEAWLKEDDHRDLTWFIGDVKENTYDLVCQLTNEGLRQTEIQKRIKPPVSRQRISFLVKEGLKKGDIKQIVDQFTIPTS